MGIPGFTLGGRLDLSSAVVAAGTLPEREWQCQPIELRPVTGRGKAAVQRTALVREE